MNGNKGATTSGNDSRQGVKETTPEDRQRFVRAIWPHARDAAERLGVDPRLLVAQAAIETGWGKAIARHPDGTSSYNLFNIKTHHSWHGPSVQKPTREVEDGRNITVNASFRAYGSLSESFQDYVHFLQTNPRYRQALQARTDAEFIHGIHRAGYATDPEYAAKVLATMRGPTLQRILGEFRPEANRRPDLPESERANTGPAAVPPDVAHGKSPQGPASGAGPAHGPDGGPSGAGKVPPDVGSPIPGSPQGPHAPALSQPETEANGPDPRYKRELEPGCMF